MKILISDFDRTLYTDAYEKNIEMINKFRKKGNIFAVATGRPLVFLKKDLGKLNADYYICNDGTTIFDHEFNLLHCETIDKKITKKIINDLLNSNSLKDWFISEPTEITKNYDGIICGILGKPLDHNNKFTDNINNTYTEVYAYNSTSWINIVRNGISKKSGILKLMELKNFKYEDIITVGDNYNDIEMNKYFESYCVKNSKKELIQASKHQVNEVFDIINKTNQIND